MPIVKNIFTGQLFSIYLQCQQLQMTSRSLHTDSDIAFNIGLSNMLRHCSKAHIHILRIASDYQVPFEDVEIDSIHYTFNLLWV